MRRLHEITFKRKLLLFAALTSGGSLLIATAATLASRWREMHEVVSARVSVQADIVASNLAAAITFEDAKSAVETLAAFRMDPNVLTASVCSASRQSFAIYRNPLESLDPLDCGQAIGQSFSDQSLDIVRPILLKDEAIGTVAVRYGLATLRADLIQESLLALLILGSALLASMLLSSPVRKAMLAPVSELARTAQSIAETGNYETRVVKHAADELGHLADAFNLMVSQVQERDVALRTAKDELEHRVEERTAELAHQRARLSAILGDINAIVWEADPKTWQFSFVSDRAKDILGYPVDRWLNEPDFWVNLIHPDDRQQAVATCTVATQRREDHSFTYRALTADGRVVWLQDLVRVITDDSGSMTLRGLMIDIDETKKLELSLQAARIAAEEASQSKSEFLANMSHEIRTPMTAILGFAEQLARHDLPPEEQEDAVQTIHRNGKHLLSVINDILDLSRLEAGKFDILRRRCDVTNIVADVCSLMRVPATAKGLALDVSYEGSIPSSIETDELRLRQILLNLLSNAIKFTESGNVRIRVSVDGIQSSAPTLRISVCDSGIGISAEALPRLFQPFSQVDSSLTRRFGGTGLGLRIAKKLAELLGGTITVDSTPGTGSNFHVAIACGCLDGIDMHTKVTEGCKESGSSHPAPAKPNPEGQARLSANILFAEDGPDNQRLIGHILRKAGATVQVVENGALAVEAALKSVATTQPFDVILMDMQMPVMDGYTATQSLRNQGYSGLIIALTAHALSGDREKCLAAGCDEFATKPVQQAKLIAFLQDQLQRAAAGSLARDTL